jgi:hypothetical protein
VFLLEENKNLGAKTWSRIVINFSVERSLLYENSIFIIFGFQSYIEIWRQMDLQRRKVLNERIGHFLSRRLESSVIHFRLDILDDESLLT